jgi:glycosyltransferase involved in cell wall biosynthesis
MKTIAYLVNRYPAISHTFIRREILALEECGWHVLRFSLRSTAGEVHDPADLEEAKRTRAILAAAKLSLAFAVLKAFVAQPIRFFRAFFQAIGLGFASRRGLIRHFAYLAEACLLRQWLAEQNVSHLHAHFGTNSTTVALLCNTLGGPGYSFTVHGPEEFDRPEAIGLAEKIKHAKFVVAVSEFGRSQLYRWCPHSEWRKIHVIHCGVDESFLSAPLSPVPDVNRLVCVGRLCEQKGQLLLVEAVSILAKQGLSLKMAFVGDGEMRQELEALTAKLGIESSIEFAGWKSGHEVREEILRSRALVLPSFAEGLPVVLMEALALGRPVISTYIAGIPELVIPGECGWLVPAGDVESLATTIRTALNAAPELLSRLGETGLTSVAQNHHVKKEAARLSGILSATMNMQTQELPNVYHCETGISRSYALPHASDLS